ncbi:MAG: hypothetical protein RLZZ182_2124 [Pseudomonadota bacterium]
MTTNLPPLEWRFIAFIPYGDAAELPADTAWDVWDEVVLEMDEVLKQQPNAKKNE